MTEMAVLVKPAIWPITNLEEIQLGLVMLCYVHETTGVPCAIEIDRASSTF